MKYYECLCCGSILSLVFFIFLFLFLGMVVYDNGFEAKENKIFYIKDKIEPQHLHS